MELRPTAEYGLLSSGLVWRNGWPRREHPLAVTATLVTPATRGSASTFGLPRRARVRDSHPRWWPSTVRASWSVDASVGGVRRRSGPSLGRCATSPRPVAPDRAALEGMTRFGVRPFSLPAATSSAFECSGRVPPHQCWQLSSPSRPAPFVLTASFGGCGRVEPGRRHVFAARGPFGPARVGGLRGGPP